MLVQNRGGKPRTKHCFAIALLGRGRPELLITLRQLGPVANGIGRKTYPTTALNSEIPSLAQTTRCETRNRRCR
eukprot:8869553-Lingulodinium_polyedra.AAC.1